jgi:hypothetical protein
MQDAAYELPRTPILGTSVNNPSFLTLLSEKCQRFIGNSSPVAIVGIVMAEVSLPEALGRKEQRKGKPEEAKGHCTGTGSRKEVAPWRT